MATTPVDPQVLQAMLPYFTEVFGNESSHHSLGLRARAACDHARSAVAGFLGAQPSEIVFTSGATEANNLALRGVMRAVCPQGGHLITQATEHRAVLDVCAALQDSGHRVTILATDAQGSVDPAAVQATICQDTALVSLMHTNNEVGTVQPLAAVGALCREAGVLLHSDAAQAATWADLNVDRLQVDLLSLSAHKAYGPKGAGALYVRRRDPRVRLQAQQVGGGQEGNRRCGTLNVPGIVGMGAALALCQRRAAGDAVHLAGLRNALQERILEEVGDVVVHGHLTARHPGLLSVSFLGVNAGALLAGMRQVALSTGSACAQGRGSHVLAALGVPEAQAQATLRLGFGRGSTAAEVDWVAARLATLVPQLRAGLTG
jgi:cysteine desulfurase